MSEFKSIKQAMDYLVSVNGAYWDENSDDGRYAATAPKGDDTVFVYGETVIEAVTNLKAALEG